MVLVKFILFLFTRGKIVETLNFQQIIILEISRSDAIFNLFLLLLSIYELLKFLIFKILL